MAIQFRLPSPSGALPPRRALAALLLAGGLAALASPLHAQSPGVIPPEGRAWRIEGAFEDGDESRNLSGIACAASDGAARSCLLVGDEKRYARLVSVVEGAIRPGAVVPLLPNREEGEQFKDTDAEAADFEDGFYYVAGSHGASRRSGRYERSRFFLYRFPVDRVTGLPTFQAGDDEPAGEVERSGRLEAILAALPLLKDHACTRGGPCRPLQEGGINIEGLAVREGSLYLGLRGPSLDGAAFIVKVGRDAVFGPAEARPEVFRPRLGEGMGVRDLVKVPDGFLILAGPARPGGEDEVGEAAVFFWAGLGNEAVRLGTLGGLGLGAKPEALLVLGADERGYRVLAISDGPDGGAPAEYRLPRQP